MKLILITIITVLTFYSYSQNNKYIFIQDGKNFRTNKLFHWTDSIQAENEIKIDTTTYKRYQPCLVKIINVGDSTESFRFPNESSINFGKYKDSLKDVNIYTGINVEYKYAKQIADSLKKENIPFDVTPNLNSKQKYRLRFFAWHHIPNDDKSLPYDERRKLAENNYNIFETKFREEFSEVDSTNIWIFSMMPGHLDVSIFTESPNFDFTRLNSFDIGFEYKPVIRPRLYDITIFEEQ